MSNQTRYLISPNLIQAIDLLGADVGIVMRRAGLSPSLLGPGSPGITSTQLFAIWRALEDISSSKNIAFTLGTALAKSAYVPAAVGFSCSPDIVTGLQRLALFKPLAGPLRVTVVEQPEVVEVRFSTVTDPNVVPPSMYVMELAYVTSLCRNLTKHSIQPVAASAPAPACSNPEVAELLGVQITPSDTPSLTLSAVDAFLPLDPDYLEAWASMLHPDNVNHDLPRRDQSISVRVRETLREMLPGGDASADTVCRHLNMSRRSLQRHLQQEGKTFKGILDGLRLCLATRYLRQPQLRIDEIAFLLAYRNPNSFYRAFNAWTGKTPSAIRAELD